MKNTIVVRNFVKVYDEFIAEEAILPGMLLEITSANKVKKHATAGGNVTPPLFAIEEEFRLAGLDTAYAIGDRIVCWQPTAGDIVYAILADGENVVIGDKLESDGLGRLKKHTVEQLASADAQLVNTVYSRPIVGIMLEAQDLSALDGSNSSLESNSQRVLVRIV